MDKLLFLNVYPAALGIKQRSSLCVEQQRHKSLTSGLTVLDLASSSSLSSSALKEEGPGQLLCPVQGPRGPASDLLVESWGSSRHFSCLSLAAKELSLQDPGWKHRSQLWKTSPKPEVTKDRTQG